MDYLPFPLGPYFLVCVILGVGVEPTFFTFPNLCLLHSQKRVGLPSVISDKHRGDECNLLWFFN